LRCLAYARRDLAERTFYQWFASTRTLTLNRGSLETGHYLFDGKHIVQSAQFPFPETVAVFFRFTA
jgi:hypothetical protein